MKIIQIIKKCLNIGENALACNTVISEVDYTVGDRLLNSCVCSYNEWDPLEEVIVGTMVGAAVPTWNVVVEATMPSCHKDYFLKNVGKRFGEPYIDEAIEELDNFSNILKKRGIIVRRPESIEKQCSFATPAWKQPGGLYSAMPRDSLLVVGNTIIEAPMAWRSRYFETDAFREILKEYFKHGANWISAPKPQLLDTSFNARYDRKDPYRENQFATTEFEVLFDAADFVRCGKDIFAQRSHVTNDLGISWVRRVLGDKYNVHKIEVVDSAPMHIDASFMPLAPGKLLINSNRIKKIPHQFSDWEIRAAPEPDLPSDHLLYMSSSWLSMNVLMLDEKTVVVEADEKSTQDFFINWGLDVVPVKFRNVMRFGGAFHCVTCDIRRQGKLQNYF